MVVFVFMLKKDTTLFFETTWLYDVILHDFRKKRKKNENLNWDIGTMDYGLLTFYFLWIWGDLGLSTRPLTMSLSPRLVKSVFEYVIEEHGGLPHVHHNHGP